MNFRNVIGMQPQAPLREDAETVSVKLGSSKPRRGALPLHVPRVVTGNPTRVAIVAASVRILGGQAVQAERLLSGWRNDADVSAWFVPVNPIPPRSFAWLLRFKYVRTIVTQIFYWPLLVRELLRADVVHV